ncbi:hypothetical protein LIER_16744 [Lithospermum erythrorhizon]|uniref:Gag-pol polyprotein n=1 Tax=Lithospermum erythrorhizon TaxID=34254 RepID=A0AAV3Q7T4_LITER
MEEDETIAAYSTRINDMANQAFALGEPKSNEKHVRKVLRSLPKRFESKVTATEETQDLTDMRLDNLIGNLTTYAIKFDSTELVKKKGIVLNASCNEGGKKNISNSSIICTAKEARKKGPTTTRWVTTSHQQEQRIPNFIRKTMADHQQGRSSERKYVWRCYHYGRKGHIAPYFYKVYGRDEPSTTHPRCSG